MQSLYLWRPIPHRTIGVRLAGSVAKPRQDGEGPVKGFHEIPGPKPLPVIGNLWRYLPFIGQYSFKRLNKAHEHFYEKYGSLVREVVMGDRVLVHVFNPKDMHTVYKNEGRRPQRISHRALAKYRKDRPKVYNCAGLFPSNGEEWYRFRHLFQKLLMSPKIADGCTSAIEDITDDLVSKIKTLVDDKGECDLQPDLFHWALECIGAITLNRRLGCLSSEGSEEVEKLVKSANDIHDAVSKTENNPLFQYMYTWSYATLLKAQDYLASYVEKYMGEAMKEIAQGRRTDSLLAKMLADEEVDRKDIFTMILDMFLAGIDTTAYTTAFCLYNLTRNKHVQDRLREELIKRLPSKDCRIDKVTEQIPYLQWVIQETLRVNPVSIGTGRVLPNDLVLSGYIIPAGTMVILQHQIASKQSMHFKDPEKFFPERWSNKDCGGITSSPFGYGPRLCMGMRFAKKEMYIAVAKLVRNFEMSYHHGDIGTMNRLIIVPDKPLKLRFKPVER